MIKRNPERKFHSVKYKPPWIPENIYYLRSGDSCYLPSDNYMYKSIPELMFDDHEFLVKALKIIVSQANGLGVIRQYKMGLDDCLRLSKQIKPKEIFHQHLEFYLEAGERMAPDKKGKMPCLHCRSRRAKPVRYYALVNQGSGGFPADHKLASCDKAKCLQQLKSYAYFRYNRSIQKQEFTFSLVGIMSQYLNHDDYLLYKEGFKKLFMQIFGLKEINDRIAFNFFTKFNLSNP